MKKIAPFFSFLTVFVITSCSVDPVEVSTQRNQTTQATQLTVEPTFMSGDMNGFSYSNLKPQTYVDATSFQTEVETYNMTPTTTYNYLLLQGSDIRLTDAPQSSSILINLRIPQCKWAAGTYTLGDDENTGINGTDCVASLIEIGSGKKAKAVSGTVTISEFNTSTKTIKGTFSFSYFIQNGTALEGPYQVTNGEFKYKLDAPYFSI